MNTETYLNHPNFGLLYRICLLEENQELFTTLYAQRLFFLVKFSSDGVTFEPISRSDARVLVENRLRQLRMTGSPVEHKKLQGIYQRTFQ